MSTITTSDVLDVRQLADIARAADTVLEDEESDMAVRDDAREDLTALAALLSDLGYPDTALDGEAIADTLERVGDHQDVTLIRDDYFTTYAEQLAEDIGAIDRNAQWPMSYIDWEAAANALRQDYSECELDGVTYLIRS